MVAYEAAVTHEPTQGALDGPGPGQDRVRSEEAVRMGGAGKRSMWNAGGQERSRQSPVLPAFLFSRFSLRSVSPQSRFVSAPVAATVTSDGTRPDLQARGAVASLSLRLTTWTTRQARWPQAAAARSFPMWPPSTQRCLNHLSPIRTAYSSARPPAGQGVPAGVPCPPWNTPRVSDRKSAPGYDHEKVGSAAGDNAPPEPETSGSPSLRFHPRPTRDADEIEGLVRDRNLGRPAHPPRKTKQPAGQQQVEKFGGEGGIRTPVTDFVRKPV